ncbi:adenine nucleotide alpha hydrolase family protein [Photobacterium leiognathi]|uniref:hypothetical protein n=1 Tax=Photobacterium leiognathi TaxID=553611 RepID=UPI00298264B9|nr:hypothetical protein [Photobacterium leiognathi]
MDLRKDTKDAFDIVINRIKKILLSGYGLTVATSWGKDSMCLSICAVEAMNQLKAEGFVLKSPVLFLHSNTLVENPSLDDYTYDIGNELRYYAEINDLNLEYHIAEPTITNTFIYKTIGYGKLPIYPGQQRHCSIDLKITPLNNLQKEISKTIGSNAEYVAITGKRYSESKDREQRMRDNNEKPDHICIASDGTRAQHVMADIELDDVYGLLHYQSQKDQIYSSFTKDGTERTLELYRSANDGGCLAAKAESTLKSEPCGARFGCFTCTAAGKEDTSLINMIASDTEKYGYLMEHVRFREFLLAIRFDWSRRDATRGQYNSQTNHLTVSPDYFNYETRRNLLRYLISMDADELERSGGVPRYQHVTERDIVAIDIMWGIQGCSDRGFSALEVWHEVHNLGKRYRVPEIQDYHKEIVPQKKYFDLTDYDLDEVGPTMFTNSVYRSQIEEISNNVGYSEGYTCPITGRKLAGCDFLETSFSLEICNESAINMVEQMTQDPDFIYNRNHFTNDQAVLVPFANGVAKTSKQHFKKFHRMAKMTKLRELISQKNDYPFNLSQFMYGNAKSEYEYNMTSNAKGDAQGQGSFLDTPGFVSREEKFESRLIMKTQDHKRSDTLTNRIKIKKDSNEEATKPPEHMQLNLLI